MKQRIHSIDIVRGIIMIIMALDHVRGFLHYPGPSPMNLPTTTITLFFTRWVTHFCAPTFVFLAGVSAYLAGQRRSKNQLSQFLLKRGAWLILSDLLIISFLFTFDPAYHVLVLEVLWAIGFGMIILAILIWTPKWVIAAVGLTIILGHDLLDHVQPNTPMLTLFFTAVGSFFRIGPDRIIVELYSILPWSAILLMGYLFGSLFRTGFDAKRRQKVLLMAGSGLILLFIILRWINQYGDPFQWSVQPRSSFTILSFLNATKQPPSLLFMCMTLGPILVLLSIAERFKGRFWEVCRVYGNVPYFYFILHLCTIRILNIFLIIIEGLPLKSDGDPLVWQAPSFGYPLWAVYVFWVFVVVILYYPCRSYMQYKKANTSWWLSYV